MDSLFPKQFVVDCTNLIPVMTFFNIQKPHFLTYCNVLNILNRYSGYTEMIRCSGEIHIAGVTDIFEKHIKPTISLPYLIVSEEHLVCMSAELPDWLIIHYGFQHKVTSTELPYSIPVHSDPA